MKIIKLIIPCLAAALIAGCGADNTGSEAVQAPQTGQTETVTAAGTTVLQTTAAETEASAASAEAEEASAGSTIQTGILTSPEDISLTDSGDGMSYTFEYGGRTFYAAYTPDNWQITDSYLITDTGDMELICRALISVNPVHGRDMTSYRTPEDMAEEWVQHNLAYQLLPDDHPWKSRAKDVDLDPADQGKTMYEMFLSKASE